jgi:hypothetical protein
MIKKFQSLWSVIAIDDIEVENIGGTFYCFTTEIGALRLFKEYNSFDRNLKTNMGYSTNRRSWYFRMEN